MAVDPESESELDVLPPRLKDAFDRLRGERPFVPPAVDAAVLKAARARLGAEFEPGDEPRHTVGVPGWSWFLARLGPRTRWAACAAAALVLALSLVDWRALRKPTVAGDLDGSGGVDILDAFALARAMARGTQPPPGADANHDGVVDQRDVEALAAQAVTLEPGPGS